MLKVGCIVLWLALCHRCDASMADLERLVREMKEAGELFGVAAASRRHMQQPKNATAEEAFCAFRENATATAAQLVEKLEDMAQADAGNTRLKDLLHKGRLHAGTCAVVSNSGVLLDHGYGAEIDRADLVFRFNDAQAGPGDLAPHVGTRDDVRFLNNEGAKLLKHRNSLPGSPHALYVLQRVWENPGILVSKVNGHSAMNETTKGFLLPARRAHPDAHIVMSSQDVQEVSNNIMHNIFGVPERQHYTLERKLTTGFYGLLTAMAICDEVHAYGFVDTPGAAKAPYHYYGTLMNKPGTDTQTHDTYSQEKSFWRMVSRNTDVDQTEKSVLPGFRSLRCS
mmetsp:Transcript_44023/g.80450  ORF Transcript_44023/g.80450 Transcript_44023/m.80450 type:complete len:339 (-) Transcript_44023:30-1046(-)